MIPTSRSRPGSVQGDLSNKEGISKVYDEIAKQSPAGINILSVC